MKACECIFKILGIKGNSFRNTVRKTDRDHFDESFKRRVKCAWYLDEILDSGKKWDYLFVMYVKERSHGVFVEIHKANSDIRGKYDSIKNVVRQVKGCVDKIDVILSPTGQFKKRKFAVKGIKIKRWVTLEDIIGQQRKGT